MAILAGLLLLQVMRLIRTSFWVEQADQVISEANAARSHVLEMESALLASTQALPWRNRERYRNAEFALKQSEVKLTELVSDHSPQSAQLAGIRKSTDQELNRFSDQAAFPIPHEPGFEILHQIQQDWLNFIQTEEVMREGRSRAAELAGSLALGFSAGLTLLLGFAISVYIRRQFLSLSGAYTRATQAQAEALALLESLLERAPVGFAFFDPELKFLRINDFLAKLTGKERKEVVGGSFAGLFPEAAARLEPLLKESLNTGAAVANREIRWRAVPTGSQERHWLMSVYPVCVEGSRRILGVAFVVMEITERIEAERARERLLLEARQAVEARDEFLSVASHEIKTPITTIKLQGQLLVQVLAPSKLHRASPILIQRMLTLMNDQIERLERLVGQLLDVTRIRANRLSLEPEAFDFTDLIHEVAGRFSAELSRASSALELALPPTCRVWLDRSRIDQLLTNLLSNAVKFGAGKTIAIRVSCQENQFRLDVEDHGIGIEPKSLSRLFGKFERAVTSRNFGGLGLGLYICRQVVQSHGGRIWAESSPGNGSTFRVEMPRQAAGLEEVKLELKRG